MIGNDWDNELSIIWNSPGFHNFMKIVDREYENKIIYPPKEDIFAALKNTSFKDVKVVIVGQDPYHGEGEAMGLSFSVHKGIKLPPSLKNIYQEMYDDLGIKPVTSGDLTKWTKEGVLLLNATLTVVKDTPNSHSKIGWDKFTDYVIKKINTKEEPVVFILWGNFARSKKAFITNPKHLVIESAHPSPFSARNGFFGSKPFSKTNEFLTKNNIKPIDWDLSK
ncbi:MAG: uracil-DNA glycosylase [Bacilli bacterium]|nr:uracil-DNA glycosylase [Bacilli bacterium]